jgi:hypothetical protein
VRENDGGFDDVAGVDRALREAYRDDPVWRRILAGVPVRSPKPFPVRAAILLAVLLVSLGLLVPHGTPHGPAQPGGLHQLPAGPVTMAWGEPVQALAAAAAESGMVGDPKALWWGRVTGPRARKILKQALNGPIPRAMDVLLMRAPDYASVSGYANVGSMGLPYEYPATPDWTIDTFTLSGENVVITGVTAKMAKALQRLGLRSLWWPRHWQDRVWVRPAWPAGASEQDRAGTYAVLTTRRQAAALIWCPAISQWHDTLPASGPVWVVVPPGGGAFVVDATTGLWTTDLKTTGWFPPRHLGQPHLAGPLAAMSTVMRTNLAEGQLYR